jgi:hypothetical protein
MSQRRGSKSKGGRAREQGKTRLLNVELETFLDDALEACRQKERRTKKAIVTLALEDYLARAGFWPPPPKQ